MGKILLFYKYISIAYPKQILKWQREICEELGLTGRIILAQEGINATLGGSEEGTSQYKKLMNSHELFGGIDWKESPGCAEMFPRLRIVIKNEIVNLGIDPKKLTTKNGGTHLSPQETHELLTNKPDDLVIIDCRNSYESQVGSFTDAIKPDTRYFREFPEYVDNNIDLIKDKQVLMFCTGGIRCERASAYVNNKNAAKKVYQMDGGIHRYIEQYPEGFFRGKNYVFDGRITVKVNDDVLGSCYVCKRSCDAFINCLNAKCNKHIICCAECLQKYKGTCGIECQKLIKENKTHQRPPFQSCQETIKPQ